MRARRTILKLLLFLLAGAIINVGVAWVTVLSAPEQTLDDTWSGGYVRDSVPSSESDLAWARSRGRSESWVDF